MVVHGAAGATSAGFGAVWSLSIEEQFYLVWPIIVACMRPAMLKLFCVSIVLASFPMRAMLAWHGVQDLALYHATFTRIDGLAVGAVLAIAARHGGLAAARPHMAGATMVAALACGALVMAPLGHPNANALVFAGVASALALGWGTILLLTVTSRGGWHRLMERPFFRWFGKYSYAIYLFQAPVDHVPTSATYLHALGWVAYAVVGIATTSLLAMCSWYAWEQPFLSLKRYFPRVQGSTPVPMPVP